MTENFAPISWIAKTIYVPRMGSWQCYKQKQERLSID